MEAPPGLVYRRGVVSEEEGARLLAFLTGVEFESVTMRGRTARRTVRHYGYGYGYESRSLTPADPLPEELVWLRDGCAGLADVVAGDPAETLVTCYPAGAGIGWHRDAPMFGRVIGVSLGAPARMRFRRGGGEQRRVWELELEPRSAYVLRGSSRWVWQHSISPVAELRYSITFRTLRS